MMTAQSSGGALLALQYNSAQGYGGLISADANGNKAGTLGNMASIGYSTKAKELLGIIPTDKKETVAMAPAP